MINDRQLVTEGTLLEIEGNINEIEADFRQVQGLILTEDDLKCILYQKLSSIPSLDLSGCTEDDGHNIRASRVHAEVSWYDKNGKLTIKPDITVLEPRNLRILRSTEKGVRLPSKGFTLEGDAIIFELKFIRQKSGITPSVFKREIQKDWDKIQGLFKKLRFASPRDQIFCFFVIFGKSNRTCPEFDTFLCENECSNRHKIIYRSGNVY